MIEEQDERKQLADAVGVDLTVRRPQAELPVIRWRLAGRHGREPATLQRHLNRSGELDGILGRTGVEDFTVDTTAALDAYVAASVVNAAGWQ
ncbi:hypothetical protein ACFY0P_44460 [Streptomyces sp. NPDC001714]|uniref:hypothetical protein n=1 Tax=Streptomyces sp. NPDC001714 TaxID=3364603 RepID=UPI003690A065